MKAQDAYLTVRDMLRKAGVEDAGFDADALFAHVAGVSRLFTDEIDEAKWQELLALAQRRAKREPLQYILGSWPFLDLELAVGPGVLAPRPETEEVCLAAAQLLRDAGLEQPDILDLCSGTGALALGLQSLLPAARVTAVELHGQAFRYLAQNVATMMAEGGNVPLAVEADALAYYKELLPESLDLLVANPPYVTEAEYAGLAPEVHAEPRTALVAQQEGLAFYRAFARDYRKALRPGGRLVFEIGAGQGDALRAILAENGWDSIEIRRDLAGHDRIALAQSPPFSQNNR